MSNTKTPFKTVFVREERNCKIKTQRDAALAWGATEKAIWQQGKENENIEAFLDQIRPGDWVGIYRLELFVARGSMVKGSRSHALRKVIDALLDHQVTVFELESGRSCKSTEDIIGMFADAMDRMRAFRGQTGPKKGKGRAPIIFTDEEKEIIRDCWNNKQFTNPEQRIAEINKRGKTKKFPRLAKLTLSTFYRKRGEIFQESKSD